MYSDVTGILLAGGKSTRMGVNKALVKIGDEILIERMVKLLSNIFNRVICITNTPNEYNFLNIPLFRDFYDYKGPLAGIHSGLYHSDTMQNFVLSVDMPLINEQMIKYIVDFPTSSPITVCKAGGFIQQLAGRYSKAVLPIGEKYLVNSTAKNSNNAHSKHQYNVLSLIKEAGAEIIEAGSLEFYSNDLFYNMNHPEDLRYIISKLR